MLFLETLFNKYGLKMVRVFVVWFVGFNSDCFTQRYSLKPFKELTLGIVF